MSEGHDDVEIKTKEEKVELKEEESDYVKGETTEEEDNVSEHGDVKREINMSDFIKKEVKKETVTKEEKKEIKSEVVNDEIIDLKLNVKEEVVDETEKVKEELEEDSEDTMNRDLVEGKGVKTEVKEEGKKEKGGEDNDDRGNIEKEDGDDVSISKDDADEVS